MIQPPLHDGSNTPILTRVKRITWLLGAAFVVACGGADQTTLLDDSGAPDQSTGVDASQPPPDAGINDATLPPDDAPSDAPTIIDVVTVDVPIKPIDSQIQCGTTTCSAQTQLCCHHTGNINTPFECVAGFNDCKDTGDVPINCSTPANCASEGDPGDVCCAEPGGPPLNGGCTGFTSPSSVGCKATCTGQGEFIVGCTTQLDCPNTETCGQSTCSLPGYEICK
jgi:hypothetical protein